MTLLMPRATASWLIENTTLTFKQIADFCQLHTIEVRAIADEDVDNYLVPFNPIVSGQLTLKELKRCESDPETRLDQKILHKDENKRKS